jgi:hypothetical protein
MAMSEEFKRALAEGWEKAKEEKAKRRAENRERWRTRRDWSDDNKHKIAVEVEDPSGKEGVSTSLQRLRSIMADPNVALHRRLDAAEVILTFELGPGAGVGVDPDQIAAASFKFLRAVSDDATTPDALKFRALKSIVGIENARVAAKSGAEANIAKRQLVINLVNSVRSRLYREAGVWPVVVASGSDWGLQWEDDFPWPSEWPGDWAWPATGFNAKLQHGVSQSFLVELRSIRARNRADDWEKFLTPTN